MTELKAAKIQALTRRPADDEVTEAMIERGYMAAKVDGLTGPRKDCERLVELILRAALKQEDDHDGQA